MDFIKKNNLVVKHKDANCFEKDLELFKVHCPKSNLHSQIKRVNSFNKHILDSQMLYELLDKVTIEVIINNRNAPISDTLPIEGKPEIILIEEKCIELKEKESEIEILKSALAAKDSEIEDLKSLQRDLASDLETKEEDLEMKEEELNDRETDLDEKESELNAKEEELKTKSVTTKKKVSKKSSKT